MRVNPLVSVIIPAYNSEKYLGETVESVLRQTYKTFEIIIVNDGSTDGTLRIAQSLSSKDKRIKVFSIPPAGRPSVPRNLGINKAEGELIAFLDSDDIWTENKLAQQVEVFRKNPGLSFVYSMSVTFGDVNLLSPYYEVFPLFFLAAKNYDDLVKRGNTIPLSGVLADAGRLKEAGGFDEDPELKVEDYELWLRLGRNGSFRFIPRLHVYYRIHSSQFSSDWETRMERLKYLEKKTGIKLPSYEFRRLRGGVYLLFRNLLHLEVYLVARVLGIFDRLVR